MHDPGEGASVDRLKEECCEKLHCHNNYCYAAMSEKGIWDQCPENAMPLHMCDGHWPWSHEISDKMAAIKAKSANEIKNGCCRMRCYGTMKSRNLECPAGYKKRSMGDGHDPFGNDWDSKTDKEITEGCCQKLNQCSLTLRGKGLSCDNYGRAPHGGCTLLSAQHPLIQRSVCFERERERGFYFIAVDNASSLHLSLLTATAAHQKPSTAKST